MVMARSMKKERKSAMSPSKGKACEGRNRGACIVLGTGILAHGIIESPLCARGVAKHSIQGAEKFRISRSSD